MPLGFGHDLLQENDYIRTFTLTIPSGCRVVLHEGTAIKQSGYFRAVLGNGAQFEETASRTINLEEDIEDMILLKMARYLCTGSANFNFKDPNSFLAAFKLYFLADYLEMPWLKKRLIDQYFWACRHGKIEPTIEATDLLFRNLDIAHELRSLLVCHWRDSLGKLGKKHWPEYGDKHFLGELFNHTWRRQGTPSLKCRQSLANIRPLVFYDEDVVRAIAEQRRAQPAEARNRRSRY